MAINKSIELRAGSAVFATYWVISYIYLDVFSQKATISLNGYKDKTTFQTSLGQGYIDQRQVEISPEEFPDASALAALLGPAETAVLADIQFIDGTIDDA